MKKTLTILAVFFIAANFAYAQGISLGLTGGLTVVTGPDQLKKDISEGGAGFSSAPHFGVKGKFSLPLIPLRITGQVLYTSFSSDGEFDTGAIVVDAEAESSLLIVGAGLEYALVPGPVSPYAAFDLFYASQGETTTKAVGTGFSQEQNIEGEGRTGIGVGAGLEFGLLPMLDIDISAKYNINNLIGKEDGEETFSTLNLSATIFLGL